MNIFNITQPSFKTWKWLVIKLFDIHSPHVTPSTAWYWVEFFYWGHLFANVQFSCIWFTDNGIAYKELWEKKVHIYTEVLCIFSSLSSNEWPIKIHNSLIYIYRLPSSKFFESLSLFNNLHKAEWCMCPSLTMNCNGQ